MNSAFTTKDKWEASRTVGDGESQPYQDYIPDTIIPQSGKIKKLGNSPTRSKGIVPYIRNPDPGVQSWKWKMPKCPVLEICGNENQKTEL